MIFGSRWGFFWSLKPFTQLSSYEISFVILLGAKDGPDGHLLVLTEPIVVGGFHRNSYSVDQKSGYCRRSSLTVDRIENLMAHYEVQLLILPTRAPFRLKIPTYLSKRIFLRFSESGSQNEKFIK